MADDEIFKEILREVKDLGTTCAVIKDRVERTQDDVAKINGQVRGNTADIARLETQTGAQEKDLDELKSTARSAGGVAGAVAGGSLGTILSAALRALWPSS